MEDRGFGYWVKLVASTAVAIGVIAWFLFDVALTAFELGVLASDLESVRSGDFVGRSLVIGFAFGFVTAVFLSLCSSVRAGVTVFILCCLGFGAITLRLEGQVIYVLISLTWLLTLFVSMAFVPKWVGHIRGKYIEQSEQDSQRG